MCFESNAFVKFFVAAVFISHNCFALSLASQEDAGNALAFSLQSLVITKSLLDNFCKPGSAS